MKKLLFFSLVLAALASCQVKTGSGNIITENKPVDNFSGVEVGGNFDVTLQQGNACKLSIQADDNVIEDIIAEVHNGKLDIRYRNNVSIRNADIKIYIESPSITYIEASASARVKTPGALKADKKITLEVSSAANVQIAVDAPDIDAEANSGSTLAIKGRTKNFDGEASSGATLDAGELLSENAKADVSSGASINLHASVNLSAEASSGGSINYRGNPTLTKQESNSGGSINKKD